MQDYAKASILRRGTAFYIDLCISTLIVSILAFLVFYQYKLDIFDFFDFIIAFGFTIFLFKDCFNGVSLGRWIMGIAVRDSNNFDVIPSNKRLIIRNFSTVVWPLEFLVLLFTKHRIGDRISHTEVIFLKKTVGFWKKAVICIFSFICFIMVFGLIITGILKNSAAYEASINYIQQNKEIQTETNGIQSYGWFPQGSINLRNNRGSAEFEIKVIGNTKNVVVWIDLSKEPLSEWKVKKFVHEEID